MMFALIGVLVTNHNPPAEEIADLVFDGEEGDELVIIATGDTKECLEQFLTQTWNRAEAFRPNQPKHKTQIHVVLTDRGRISFALWGIRSVLTHISG
jgi:hypothetical protein